AGLWAAVAGLFGAVIGSILIYQYQQLERASAERHARVQTLVDSLDTADFLGVWLIANLLESKPDAEAEATLRARHKLAERGSPARLRYALALLPIDASMVDELLEYVPSMTADQMRILIGALRPHREKVVALWPKMDGAAPSDRLR